MKTFRLLAPLASCLAPLFLSGCFTHNLPKDAYLQGIHSKIVTPWGTHELVVDMGATGSAAKNITIPEPVVPAIKPSAANVR